MRDFDCAGETKGNYLYQPYDFLLMSAFVPKDWDFRFIDSIASRHTKEECFDLLKNSRPDIIVCSVAGINWRQDLETIKEIRARYSDQFLFVFGDLFVDDYPRSEVMPWVDGIFSSPVLFNFSVLQDFTDRKQFKFSDHLGFHPLQSLGGKNLKAPRQIQVPLPRHEIFVHDTYRWPFIKNFKYTTVFTNWGCPYSCSYCILNKFPNYWRDYREIIEEMTAVKKLGFKELYIGDKSFGLPLGNTMMLLDEMICRQLGFSWSTYFHPNQYSPELLRKMKLAGCHTVVIGIETGDLKELRRYGRHVREDQMRQLIDHANELGIEVCGDFILGLPHDTKESLRELIEFACGLDIHYASFNIATPLPGSSIRELALKEKKIRPQDQHFDSSGKNIILPIGRLSSEELLEMRNEAIQKFYLRPGYLLKRLARIRGLEHLSIQVQEGLQVIKSSLMNRNL